MTVVVLVKVVLVSGVNVMKITIEIAVMMKMMDLMSVNMMMMMIMNYYSCGDEDGFDISPEDEGDS